MVLASGTRVALGYIEEVTRGTTPSTPTLKTLRATQRAPNLEKDLLESAEVASHAQESDVRHGFNRVVGTVGYQAGMTDYDDVIAYGMRGTWAAVTTGAMALNITGTNTFARASGSFITDGFRPGDIITGSGFTNSVNNANHRILTVAALSMTTDTVLTNETGSGDELLVVTGKRCDFGTTLKTITLEQQLQDVPAYRPFRGVAINQWQRSITPEAIVTDTLSLLGMSGGTFSGTSISGSAPTAPSASSPFAAFDGVMYEGSTVIAIVTSFNFTVNNNRALTGVVGSKFSPDVFEGRAQIQCELTALFDSFTLYNKFVNETESNIWLKLADPNGTDFHNLVFPRIKYNGAPMDPGQTGPITLPMPCRALVHSTYGTSFWYQRSNT